MDHELRKRGTGVIAAGHRHNRPVADTVILDYERRSAQKTIVTGVKGTRIEIDLDRPARLRTDDLLVLDDGTLVEVVAAPEPLVEARASGVAGLARLAWHLGDRHIPVQVLPNRIRARRDGAIESLLSSLGAKIASIDAPFEPEGGAYAWQHDLSCDHHDHDHDHGHGHDHDHHHAHDHGRPHKHD